MPNNRQQGLTTARYFIFVTLITMLLAAFWVLSEPVTRYKLLVKLGIKPQIEVNETAFYHTRIEPVLTKYCAACHDASKAKGDLRIDSFLYTRYSGKSEHNVIPFDSSSSQIMTRMALPENDKRLMPPLGWDKPTEDEMKVLSMWIDKGASPVLTAEDFPDAPKPVIEVEIPEIDYAAVKKMREEVVKVLKPLNQKYPHALNFIARDSHLLRFSTVSMTTPMNDQAFKELNTISPYISSLYLWNTQLTDEAKSVLLNMHNLSEAYLQGADISESTLKRLIEQNKQLSKLSVHPQLITSQIKQLCEKRNIVLKEVSHV